VKAENWRFTQLKNVSLSLSKAGYILRLRLLRQAQPHNRQIALPLNIFESREIMLTPLTSPQIFKKQLTDDL